LARARAARGDRVGRSDSDALAWVAAALLVPVAALGFTMLAKWLGVAAVTTVVLVVNAAVQAA
jgi:hypothetical protein